MELSLSPWLVRPSSGLRAWEWRKAVLMVRRRLGRKGDWVSWEVGNMDVVVALPSTCGPGMVLMRFVSVMLGVLLR